MPRAVQIRFGCVWRSEKKRILRLAPHVRGEESLGNRGSVRLGLLQRRLRRDQSELAGHAQMDDEQLA